MRRPRGDQNETLPGIGGDANARAGTNGNAAPGPADAAAAAAEGGPRPRVLLYTDGACSGNPGPGGWAYVLKHPGTGKVREGSGGAAQTTNNQMELSAVIHGLGALKQPCEVELYSDSKYVLEGLETWIDNWQRRGWRTATKAPVKNVELWQQLAKLRGQHTLRYHWVRGHSGHPENERCDELAVQASMQFGRG